MGGYKLLGLRRGWRILFTPILGVFFLIQSGCVLGGKLNREDRKLADGAPTVSQDNTNEGDDTAGDGNGDMGGDTSQDSSAQDDGGDSSDDSTQDDSGSGDGTDSNDDNGTGTDDGGQTDGADDGADGNDDGSTGTSIGDFDLIQVTADNYLPINEVGYAYLPSEFANNGMVLYLTLSSLIDPTKVDPRDMTKTELDSFVKLTGWSTDSDARLPIFSDVPGELIFFFVGANSQNEMVISNLFRVKFYYYIPSAIGFTYHKVGADSQITYVDSASTSETCPTYTVSNPIIGTNPMHPDESGEIVACRTIAAAKANLRPGANPDWLLLKRGGEWDESLGQMDVYSGVSRDEPFVISYYGGASKLRPMLRLSGADAIESLGSFTRLTDLSLVSSVPSGIGVGISGDVEDILIENLKIDGFAGSIYMDALASNTIENVSIRRNLLTNAASIGIYSSKVRGLNIEENFINQSGWTTDQLVNPKDGQSKNIEIWKDTEFVRVVKNISTQSSSAGIRLRSSGKVEMNLVAESPIGISCGIEGHATGTRCLVRENAVLEGNESLNPSTDSACHGETTGVIIGNLLSGEVSKNLVLNHAGPEVFGGGLCMDGGFNFGVRDLQLRENLVYNWPTPLRWAKGVPGVDVLNAEVSGNRFFIDEVYPFNTSRLIHHHVISTQDQTSFLPGIDYVGNTYFSAGSPSAHFKVDGAPLGEMDFASWVTQPYGNEIGSLLLSESSALPDPTRSLGSYCDSIGCSCEATSCTNQDFYDEVLEQTRTNWRPELEADAVLDYLAQGVYQ